MWRSIAGSAAWRGSNHRHPDQKSESRFPLNPVVRIRLRCGKEASGLPLVYPLNGAQVVVGWIQTTRACGLRTGPKAGWSFGNSFCGHRSNTILKTLP